MLIQFNISATKLIDLLLNRFQRMAICLKEEYVDDEKKISSVIDHVWAEHPHWSEGIQRVSSAVNVNIPSADPRSDWLDTVPIPGSKLQLLQPIKVYVANLDDVKKNAGGKNTTFSEMEIKIKLGLSISLQPTRGLPLKPDTKLPPRFCLSFDDLEFGVGVESLLTPEQKKSIADSVRDKVKDREKEMCQIVDLTSSLSEMLGGKPDIINVGISAYGPWDSVGSIAIRLEVRDPTPTLEPRYSIPESWKRFYSGDITSDLDGSLEDLSKMDWSIFIDQKIFVSAIVSKFKPQISSSRIFSLKDGPHGEWHNSRTEFGPDETFVTSNGLALVVIKFSGEAIDACDCLWGKIDVNVDVTIHTELLIKKPGLFQIHAQIGWESNQLELFCCEVTLGFQGALLGAWFGSWFGPIGAVTGAIIGFIAAVIKAIDVASSVEPPLSSLPATCTVSGGGKTLNCELPVPSTSSDLFGDLTIASILGIPGGLLLGGELKPLAKPLPADFGGISDLVPFRWDWENPCKREPEFMVRGEVTYYEEYYSGKRTPRGRVPSKVCEISIREDPLDQFKPYLKVIPRPTASGASTRLLFEIPPGELKPEYLSAPYPCHILFKTTGGARWITLGPIPKLTPEREAELKEELPHLRKIPGLCISLPYHDPFRRGELIRVTFVSDEPEDWFGLIGKDQVNGEDDHNIWRIIAGELMPGDRIELRTSDNRLPLAESIANNGGFAELSLLAPLKSEKTEFSLRRTFSGAQRTQPHIEASNIARSVDNGHTQDENIKENQALTIKRIQLTHQCTLYINGSCLGLAAGLFEGYSTIFILTEQGLNMYDVSSPRYPRLSYQLPGSGLHSVVIWKGMLITADSQSLTLPLDRQRSVTRTFEDSGIRALEASQEYLYALKDDDSIDVLSRNFERIRSFQMESGSPVVDIAATSRLVAVNRVDRIDVYDMQNPNGPSPARTLAINGAVKISSAKLATSNNSFYVHNANGGGRVIDFSKDSGIVTAEYHEDPWFVGAVRVDNVFARLGLNSTQLELYSIVGTKTR